MYEGGEDIFTQMEALQKKWHESTNMKTKIEVGGTRGQLVAGKSTAPAE